MENRSLIVIVTYNSSTFIEDCLISVAGQDYRNWFLVVVDNNSTDDTVQKIKDLRNQVAVFNPENFRFVHLRKNIGFAGAVNYAVFREIEGHGKHGYSGTAADFEYLVLLNPDIVLFPDSLENLLDSFGKRPEDQAGRPVSLSKTEVIEKEHLVDIPDVAVDAMKNRVGVCGGLILEYEKDIIQHMGGRITPNFVTYHEGTGRSMESLNNRPEAGISGDSVHRHGRHPEFRDGGRIRPDGNIRDTDYVTGAFFATRFSLFRGIGGFDRGYRPVYFEELDYCLKLKEAGWHVVSNLAARCRHFEGASVKRFSSRFYRHYHKNRLRCAIINLDIPEFIRVFIPAEFKWLRKGATRDQALPLLYAYLMNKIFIVYNLAVKIKNYLILSRIELK